jgi:hypothetical protein
MSSVTLITIFRSPYDHIPKLSLSYFCSSSRFLTVFYTMFWHPWNAGFHNSVNCHDRYTSSGGLPLFFLIVCGGGAIAAM